LIEEDASVRVASAFRHELKATSRRRLCGIKVPHRTTNRYRLRKAGADCARLSQAIDCRDRRKGGHCGSRRCLGWPEIV
jgi:hypothetical protein